MRNRFNKEDPLFPDLRGKIKRIVLMVSVMHTGNRVIRDDIFKCEEVFKHRDAFQNCILGQSMCVENIFILTHIFRDSKKELVKKVYEENKSKCYIISPLRHPVLVRESFRRREHLKVCSFEDHWLKLMEFSKEYDIKYIHVDQEELRDKEVLEMEKDLGIELGKHWGTKYCIKGTHDYKITQEDLDTMPKHFIEFYESTL